MSNEITAVIGVKTKSLEISINHIFIYPFTMSLLFALTAGMSAAGFALLSMNMPTIL